MKIWNIEEKNNYFTNQANTCKIGALYRDQQWVRTNYSPNRRKGLLSEYPVIIPILPAQIRGGNKQMLQLTLPT